MEIKLSVDSGVPIYQQIVDQVRLRVALGELKPDHELPTIRALAEAQVINPNTVARAYRELEVAGIVVKRGTTGTFIAEGSSSLAKRERKRILTELMDPLLAAAQGMNVTTDELLELLRERAERRLPPPKEK